MSDVHAECAPEAPMDPTDPWGTLGAHVVAAKGARGVRVGRGVTVRSLGKYDYDYTKTLSMSMSMSPCHVKCGREGANRKSP